MPIQCSPLGRTSPYMSRCEALAAQRPNVDVSKCAGITRVDWWLDCLANAPDIVTAPVPTITVSPTIQTAVSPQISPVFQQAFQPSGSPMTAGATQMAPVPGPDYAALMESQRKMYEAALAKATQPVIQQPPQFAQPAPAVMSPVPMTEQAMVAFPEPGTEPKTTPAVVAPLQKANYMPIILIAAAVVAFAALGQQKGKRHAT